VKPAGLLPLTSAERPVIGVIHLLPLPGAPVQGPGLQAVLDRAWFDASALVEGGAKGVIVENLGDAPFAAGPVEPHVVALLSRIALGIRARFGSALTVGINALRNDALGALGAAAVAQAGFVRVNVHVGAMVTDQGLLQGRARESLLYRQRIDPNLAIVADVLVKHAVPLGNQQLEDVARDTWARGRADALVISGSGTGLPTRAEDLRRARSAVPEAQLWIGSGLNAQTVAQLGPLADAAIVGTALHQAEQLDRPLDPGRIRQMVELFGGCA
jgi:membrane complex biogenesis BtpA family protein